jgi:hypothetical protein
VRPQSADSVSEKREPAFVPLALFLRICAASRTPARSNAA